MTRVDFPVEPLVRQRPGHQVRVFELGAASPVVMMNREVVDLRAGAAEDRAVPRHVVVADRDEAQRRIHREHRRPVAQVVARVGLRVAVAAHPVAPDLVPDLPGLHGERLGAAVLRAQRSVLGRGGAVGVLDPGCRLLGSRAPALDVDDQVRLGAEIPAEADELVRAEVARLPLVPPRQVDPLRALVARPDAPDPVVVLRDVSARPADEGGAQGLDALEHVGAHLVHRITRHQRHLIDPHAALAVEEDREPGERIGLRRPQREAVLLPRTIRRHAAELRRRVHFATGAVLLERRGQAPRKVPRAQPQGAPVFDPRPNRHAALMDAAALPVLDREIDPQRMLHLMRPERPRGWICHRIVPPEADRIVAAIVRIPFPVPGQPDDARRFLEPAVVQQLGVQAELDVLEHELGKLPVQAGTDAVRDRRGVDRDGGFVAGLAARGGDQCEHEHRDGETCRVHSRVHLTPRGDGFHPVPQV